MTKKKTIIRREDFGFLFWSPTLDAYFLPDHDVVRQMASFIETFDSSVTRNNWKQTYYGTLVDDLVKIGVENGVRAIDKRLANRLSAPLDVYFDYTYACNLRCSYCYNYNADRRITMSDERIVRVLSGLSEIGVMRTHLAGGEPMINPGRFESYLRTAEGVGMNVSVNCNGTMVTERTLEAVFDYGVISLTFSLDGADASANDYYRGEGTFENVRKRSRMAARRKQDLGSGPILQYKAVHMFDTPMDMYERLISIAIEDGMDRMQFHNPECSINHPRGHYGASEVIRSYYERLQHLDRLKEKYADLLEIWTVWNPVGGCADIGLPGYRGCIGGQELIAIDAIGVIRPCLMNKIELGNIFTDWDGNFGEFWRNSSKLGSYQEVVNRANPHCGPCDIYSQCRGGKKDKNYHTE